MPGIIYTYLLRKKKKGISSPKLRFYRKITFFHINLKSKPIVKGFAGGEHDSGQFDPTITMNVVGARSQGRKFY